MVKLECACLIKYAPSDSEVERTNNSVLRRIPLQVSSNAQIDPEITACIHHCRISLLIW